MIDFAFGKTVLEYCNHPGYLTESGDDCEYNAKTGGYLGTHHPCFITLDLKGEYDVRQISFKLFDVDDPCNTTSLKPTNQEYAYRILSSIDKENWVVLYDTTKVEEPYGNINGAGLRLKKYRKGWQTALLSQPIKMRYFRIHGLHNPANSGFHVVRLRLFDEKNEDIYNRSELLSIPDQCEFEKGDATPISTRLLNLTEQLSAITPEHYKTSSEYIDINNSIIENSMDMEQIDGKIEQVRKIVAPHIVEAINKQYKEGSISCMWSCVVAVCIILFNALVELVFTSDSYWQTIVRWIAVLFAIFFATYVAFPWLKFVKAKLHEYVHKLIFKIKFRFVKNDVEQQRADNNDINILYKNAMLHYSEKKEIVPFSSIFSQEIGNYDIDNGYLKISNPGWLEVHLIEPKDVSYIRFLLWDNCGSKKKQPSSRKYNYRLLLAEYDENNPQSRVWEAVYDNCKNPSNGWQEFYFEDAPKKIVGIKLQLFHTLSLSSQTDTKIVNIQAYSTPTKSISEWSNTYDKNMFYAPPVHGFSKNRVILGGINKNFCLIAENDITKKIIHFLDSIEPNLDNTDLKKIKSFKTELSANTPVDLSKQIDNLCRNIILPIDKKRQYTEVKILGFSFISNIILAVDLSPIIINGINILFLNSLLPLAGLFFDH